MKTDTKLAEVLAQSQKLQVGDLERRKADQLGYFDLDTKFEGSFAQYDKILG